MAILGCSPLLMLTGVAQAQDSEVPASAALVQPLSITGSQPLDFGTVVKPATGSCHYDVPPVGAATIQGQACQYVGGDQAPARFTLQCPPGALIQFQLVYTDRGPAGTSFAPGDSPVAIDSGSPATPFQVQPCDTDGLTTVAAGGRLSVTAAAAHGFSGTVGTIRLEVAYD